MGLYSVFVAKGNFCRFVEVFVRQVEIGSSIDVDRKALCGFIQRFFVLFVIHEGSYLKPYNRPHVKTLV